MLAKRIVLVLMALSLVQGELAFAANTAADVAVKTAQGQTVKPLPTPQNFSQAVKIVQVAERIQVASYFVRPIKGFQVMRFDQDLMALARANELVGLAENLPAFKVWWEKNKIAMLTKRNLGNPSLQGYFTEIYLIYKVEATRAKENPSDFMAWLHDKASNPLLRQVSNVTFGILAGVWNTLGPTAKNVLFFAIAASVMSQLVEPVVRPIREKATLIGNKYLGRAGLALNRWFFNDSILMETNDTINNAKKEHRAARILFQNMGYDMTLQQFEENFGKLKDAWNATNQVWLRTNPEAYRNGRSNMNDAVVMRTQIFSQNAMISVHGAETQRQGYEATIDRIAAQSTDKQGVMTASDKLLTVVEKQMKAERTSAERAKGYDAKIETIKAELVRLGALPQQVDRIVQNRRRELASYRHTATSLAAAVLHDLQYEEFNRALPKEVFELHKKMKDGMSINFFHKEFAQEIVKELDRLGFQVELKSEEVTAQIEKRNSSGKKRAATPAPEQPANQSRLSRVLNRLKGRTALPTAPAKQGKETEAVREAAKRAARK